MLIVLTRLLGEQANNQASRLLFVALVRVAHVKFYLRSNPRLPRSVRRATRRTQIERFRAKV
jgi:hypothetical protein